MKRFRAAERLRAEAHANYFILKYREWQAANLHKKGMPVGDVYLATLAYNCVFRLMGEDIDGQLETTVHTQGEKEREAPREPYDPVGVAGLSPHADTVAPVRG